MTRLAGRNLISSGCVSVCWVALCWIKMANSTNVKHARNLILAFFSVGLKQTRTKKGAKNCLKDFRFFEGPYTSSTTETMDQLSTT